MIKRILKLSICALLLISMVLCTVACNPKPSEETFKEAQKESVGDVFTQIDNVSNNIMGADPNNVSRDISLKVELSTELLSLLSSSMDDMDMSWINKLSLNLSQNSKNDIHSLALSLLHDGKDIISAHGIADMSTGNIYVAIPLLASAYLQLNLDDYMDEMAKQYPQYGFEVHKGYGTKAHYAALTEHGPCAAHRMSFLKKFYGSK